MLYVCIPPNVHNGEVIRAAQAGIHLFVEKPMSLYLDEALAMRKAIADAGVFSAVGFQQRFDTRHEAVKYFLDGQASESSKQDAGSTRVAARSGTSTADLDLSGFCHPPSAVAYALRLASNRRAFRELVATVT